VVIIESAEKFENQKNYMSYLVKNIDQFVDDNRRQVFLISILNEIFIFKFKLLNSLNTLRFIRNLRNSKLSEPFNFN
jgi:hypothetical protein